MSTGEYGRDEEPGRLLAGRYRVLAQLGRGNTNVFVSDVYISGGDNDQPLPGLPVC
ncbi:hypothetical protein ACFT9I_13785 [Streptomyces sp. NPDC057137]|uniref:hypothetical protein n=1 Tax=Streptomyces sp. NPDC057137 TaxID=3346030 RepID=UPI00364195B0